MVERSRRRGERAVQRLAGALTGVQSVAHAPFASPRLGLELHLAEDTLRFFDPARAEYLATADEHQARADREAERADREAERAEAALRRVTELETALRTAQR